MTMSLSQLSARELARIDAICLEFEERLRRGERGDIDQIVRAHGEAQADVLRAELEAVAGEVEAELAAAKVRTPLAITEPAGALSAEAEGGAAVGSRLTPGNRTHGSLAGPPPWLPTGAVLGPYRVDRLIGRGGMGEVYAGRDERLGREVAIKILSQDWADQPSRVERFGRETRAVAALSHPNIVSLYDIGEYQGRPYAVMELLVGETLREHLKRHRRLHATEVRRIGIAAADALAAAHAAGIIHRDLKPENLFLTREGGRVKLLDFGLSRTHDDGRSDSDRTATGVILGTMGYLSPEQADGHSITPRADLFSLGCVLHECFYGIRPFSGRTISESLAAILTREPERDPSIEALDPPLAEAIARCLHKRPSDRFATAEDLAAALQDDGSVTAAPVAQWDSSATLPEATLSTQVEAVRRVADAVSAVERSAPGEGASDPGTPEPVPRPPVDPDAPTLEIDGAGKKAPAIPEVSAATLSRRSLLRSSLAASLALAGIGGAAGVVRWMRSPSQIRSLAVLPLDDGAAEGGAVEGISSRQLGHGEQMAAAIADQLTRVAGLRVVPFLPLRDNGLATPLPVSAAGASRLSSRVTPDALKSIAEHLGVDAVLVGSVSSDDQGFQTIDVKLIQGSTGFQIGTYTTRVREKTNLIDQESTALKVAEGIGHELEAYHHGGPRQNGSYHCLLNGYSRMDTESVGSLRDALQCFQSAIRQDEKFPEAYAGLALTAMILAGRSDLVERTELFQMARQAAASALELEPNSGPALLATAMLDWQVDWQFDVAADIFSRCMPRMPDNWVAQHEYSLFLAAAGRFEEAERHAEQAVGLDPTSAAFRLDLARIRFFSGATSLALDEARAVVDVAKGGAAALAVGTVLDMLEHQGQIDQAASLLRDQGVAVPDAAAYWTARGETLGKFPYGPYDSELNALVMDVHRGATISDQRLLQLRNNRPPRLPLLLSAHPSFRGLRRHLSMRDLLVRPRLST